MKREGSAQLFSLVAHIWAATGQKQDPAQGWILKTGGSFHATWAGAEQGGHIKPLFKNPQQLAQCEPFALSKEVDNLGTRKVWWSSEGKATALKMRSVTLPLRYMCWWGKSE